MDLRIISNKTEFKKKFHNSLDVTKHQNPSLKVLLATANTENNIFIVGGYLRSIVNNETPRDLDLIINLNKETFKNLIEENFKNYKKNRLGGYKLFLENIVIDIWSVEDNWAFKQNLIKDIGSNYVDKIAEGTFFNYDSLVVDISTFKSNFKNYNACVKYKKLDILRKNSTYKKLNPTREANILRSFYLKTKHGLEFSSELKSYIKENIEYVSQTHGNIILKLLNILDKYEKYKQCLNEEIIKEHIRQLAVPFTRKQSKNGSNPKNLFD